jgi:hypothetical protein
MGTREVDAGVDVAAEGQRIVLPARPPRQLPECVAPRRHQAAQRAALGERAVGTPDQVGPPREVLERSEAIDFSGSHIVGARRITWQAVFDPPARSGDR